MDFLFNLLFFFYIRNFELKFLQYHLIYSKGEGFLKLKINLIDKYADLEFRHKKMLHTFSRTNQSVFCHSFIGELFI